MKMNNFVSVVCVCVWCRCSEQPPMLMWISRYFNAFRFSTIYLIYAHTIHSLIIYEFFYFLLLLFAVRHTERRGLLKTCTHNWMRQSSAHRSWPLLLTKLLLLCWYLWNSDGFNNVFCFSLLSTRCCCIGTYAIVVPWAARLNVGGSI